MTPARSDDAMKKSAVRPLSVEAVEFSPAPATEQNIRSGRKILYSGTGGISLTVVVDHPPPPYQQRGGDVHGGSGGPRVGSGGRGGKVNSPSQWASKTDPGEAPAILSAPLGDKLVSKPEMHSAQKIVLDGIPMEEVVCLEPLMASFLDAPLDSRPMAGNTVRNSSDHVVPREIRLVDLWRV